MRKQSCCHLPLQEEKTQTGQRKGKTCHIHGKVMIHRHHMPEKIKSCQCGNIYRLIKQRDLMLPFKQKPPKYGNKIVDPREIRIYPRGTGNNSSKLVSPGMYATRQKTIRKRNREKEMPCGNGAALLRRGPASVSLLLLFFHSSYSSCRRERSKAISFLYPGSSLGVSRKTAVPSGPDD